MRDIFRLDTGTGLPIVFLHGGFVDHEMWLDQIPVFASGHRVVAPDARGHGRSAVSAVPYRLADDVAALLRELETGPAVLVGVSMGAATAVETALEHPELVGGLVISGAGGTPPYFHDSWTLQAMAAWNAAMAAGDLEGSLEGFMAFVAGPYRSLDEVDPGVVRRVQEMGRKTMSRHSAGEPSLLRPVEDVWERAAGIAVPVLAVHGGIDSPDCIEMAERIVRSVRYGKAVTIDGAAHYPNMERPEVFNTMVEEFLRAL
ncbi:alpha/beta fold hydrolase [Nonomuraea typhae]|uniref:Alpha/beta fold hydrolase n=1 Tax=Nonomuraea typhae TaxID=2603600 RepID=A0ABW7YYD4_9ACTN